MNQIHAPLFSDHHCEHCGRPSIGENRCPHAIDRRYPCPRHKQEEQQRHERLRHMGR